MSRRKVDSRVEYSGERAELERREGLLGKNSLGRGDGTGETQTGDEKGKQSCCCCYCLKSHNFENEEEWNTIESII
jgi:hypothetical protein